MAKAHVKKGDEVVVIAGSELGKRGKVLEIKTKRGRAIVEGLKMIKRHTKKGSRGEQSAIIEREGLIHLSNLMLASRYDASGAAKPETTEKE
jgi:large subunit ribosomal protein L24